LGDGSQSSPEDSSRKERQAAPLSPLPLQEEEQEYLESVRIRQLVSTATFSPVPIKLEAEVD